MFQRHACKLHGQDIKLIHQEGNTSRWGIEALVEVAGDISRLFDDERVRLAMSFQTKYLGMSPFHAPSLFTILAFLEYEHGIFHGWSWFHFFKNGRDR